MREKDLGKTTSRLRDAYLFAAPILTDRDTVEGNSPRPYTQPGSLFLSVGSTVFNSKMLSDSDKPRTMWRVTSNGDFGALIS
jgi:hypothetical protein